MKRVLKTEDEPHVLVDYKQRFATAPNNLTWKNFKSQKHRREQVKNQLRQDQRGLCAYCENALIPEDESVEHFIPKDADHDRELDWTNIILCCAGGERPLPEEIENGECRYDPTGRKTCGHAKLNCTSTILNPLQLPHTPRLFKFKSETGEIMSDVSECALAGVEVALCDQTINVLGLKARRLNEARLALMNNMIEELASEGTSEPFTLERERELAAIYIPPSGPLPAFFTVLRFSLGAGAEAHLFEMGFQG